MVNVKIVNKLFQIAKLVTKILIKIVIVVKMDFI